MMCLMSVVLPAPFAPTRPYTPPRRKVSVTDDNASFAPNRRVSDEISMTESFKGVQPHPTATRTDTASPRKSAQETVRNADDELELAHRPTPREISVVRFDAQRGRRVEIKIDVQPRFKTDDRIRRRGRDGGTAERPGAGDRCVRGANEEMGKDALLVRACQNEPRADKNGVFVA